MKVARPVPWAPALLGVGAVLLGVALFLFEPATTKLFPPCPFHALTGLHCPGCGSLRTAHHLLHGDLRAALSYNPLLVVSIPFILGLWLRPEWGRRPWVPWVAFGVLVVYGVVRNLPFMPFRLLAPG